MYNYINSSVLIRKGDFISEVFFNPLTTDDDFWRCLTLATCYMYQLVQSVLKIGFAKSGIRGGGRVLAQGAMHMAAALAGYRTALVNIGWTISHLFDTHRLRNTLLPTISGSVGSFQSGGVLSGWRALTNESLLMSGCG